MVLRSDRHALVASVEKDRQTAAAPHCADS